MATGTDVGIHTGTHLDMVCWMDGMRVATGADAGARGNGSDADEECREEPVVDEATNVGRRRQIITILVRAPPLPPPSLFPALRAQRAPYTHTASLVTVTAFHSLFEGLSLRIRVAARPDKHSGASGGGGC